MNTRELKVTYTIEDLQEYDEVITNAEELRKAITAEIDWEIISELLISTGWIRVRLRYESNRLQPAQQEIIKWVMENINDSYKSHNNDWIFANEKDAALFALRWV